MKLILAALALVLVVEVRAQWHRYPGQAIGGAKDMWRAYRDMREANWKNSDKYFHARGNYDAAKRGPGGRWAAKVISDGREAWVPLVEEPKIQQLTRRPIDGGEMAETQTVTDLKDFHNGTDLKT
ncbi:serum amyloid A [Paramisgurnus dabryanus]|uniref:serum amyloid A n=1 Tax=Paramisgurnus dabryanus TaxID=90735 RepID=UPI003CCF5F6D